MVSLIASRTVLTSGFVMHEVTSSTVETDLLDQVQAGLSQYGIPRTVLTKDDTDRIVRTVVNQAFAGQELSLDLSQVTNRLAGQANSQLQPSLAFQQVYCRPGRPLRSTTISILPLIRELIPRR